MKMNEFILKIEKLTRKELKVSNDFEFSVEEVIKLRPLIQRVINEHPEFGYRMEKLADDHYQILPITA